MTRFAVAADGTRLAWTEAGAGEAVLLVMGYAFTKEMWFRVVPALAAGHRVISFDNRGVGESVMAPGPFTVETMAADAVAVLDAAGVEKAHVYGASMGGLIAQEMALSHPERVASLILACTGAKPAVVEPPRRRLRLFSVTPGPLLPRLLGRQLYGANPDPEKVREDRRVLNRMRVTKAGLHGQSHAVARHVSADRVGGLAVPTLVLHGTADRTVPYEAGRLLAAAIPGAHLVTLEGAGHGYMTDATDEANQAVVDFLAASAPVSDLRR